MSSDPANPYAPPESPVEAGPAKVKQRSRFIAVVLGTMADVGATVVFTSVMTALYVAHALSGGATVEEAMERWSAALEPGWTLSFAFMLAMGSSFSVLGGYVCGWYAGRQEVVLGTLVALGGLLILGVGEDFDWVDAVMQLLTFGCCAAGGALRRQRRLRLIGNSSV